MAEKKINVLIIGITGWLGNKIAHALLDQGNAVVSGLIRPGATALEKSKKVTDR